MQNSEHKFLSPVPPPQIQSGGTPSSIRHNSSLFSPLKQDDVTNFSSPTHRTQVRRNYTNTSHDMSIAPIQSMKSPPTSKNYTARLAPNSAPAGQLPLHLDTSIPPSAVTTANVKNKRKQRYESYFEDDDDEHPSTTQELDEQLAMEENHLQGYLLQQNEHSMEPDDSRPSSTTTTASTLSTKIKKHKNRLEDRLHEIERKFYLRSKSLYFDKLNSHREVNVNAIEQERQLRATMDWLQVRQEEQKRRNKLLDIVEQTKINLLYKNQKEIQKKLQEKLNSDEQIMEMEAKRHEIETQKLNTLIQSVNSVKQMNEMREKEMNLRSEAEKKKNQFEKQVLLEKQEQIKRKQVELEEKRIEHILHREQLRKQKQKESYEKWQNQMTNKQLNSSITMTHDM